MNKPQTLPVEGVPVKRSQVESFKAGIAMILKDEPHTPATVLFAEQTVLSATSIVLHPLNGDRLRALTNFADSWNMELMIGVSILSTLQLEFNLKSDK